MEILFKLLFVYMTCMMAGIGGIAADEASSDDCACGEENYYPRINSNGQRTTGHLYPWAVSIADQLGVSFCGGTLINKKQVLTAARCVYGKSLEDIKLILGVHDISRFDDGDLYKVAKIDVFQGYKNNSDGTYENDAAILTIDGELKKDSNIQPICLESSPKISSSKRVVVLGWGQMSEDESNVAQRLQMLKRPLVSTKECSAIWKKKFSEEKTLCMGKAMYNICAGDYGGPLQVFNNEVWELIGVASFTGPTCGDQFPGVYTKFSYIKNWVKEQSAEFKCSN